MTSASSSGIQLTRDSEALIQNFLPAQGSTGTTAEQAVLPLPLCIPQISPGFSSPFARGYNQLLVDPPISISQEDLLKFIDGLNLAITASPPLRVVDVVGMGLGFVPYHWAIIAGAVMQTAAKTAMHVLSKTLTDRYLRAANLRLFKPKGLSVRICTTAAMMALLKSEQERIKSGSDKARAALDKVGRGVGSVLLRLPLPFSSRIVRAIADPAPKVSPSGSLSESASTESMLHRRLALVNGQALALDLNVPPPNKPDGIMDTINSWGVKFDQYKAAGATPTTRREWRAQRRHERRAWRNRRGGLISSLLGPKESALERRVANADLLEHWAHDESLWVLIMNQEIDEEIAGIGTAESSADEERIDDKAFKEIIQLEEEEMMHAVSSDSDSEQGQK